MNFRLYGALQHCIVIHHCVEINLSFFLSFFTVSALGYFFLQRFLDYWGCVVRCETDFVPFLINFDQNNAEEGRLKFDKLKVRGLILMVK